MSTLAELWRQAEESDDWGELVALVDRERLFSPNEELDEVSTSALRYSLAPYRHALALLKDQDPQTRRRLIERANSQLNRFLELCRIWGIFIPTAPRDADAQRREKVADFKRRKEIGNRLKTIEAIRERRRLDADSGGDLEEIERECWLLQIEGAARDAQNTIIMNERELEMLNVRDATPQGKLRQESSHVRPAMQTVRINKDLSVEKVSLGGTSTALNRRQMLRYEVFRDRNLPTMTLDEFADQQMAALKERQERQQAQGSAEPEQGDSESDCETYKQRAWDNWKDDHEKGIGNKGYM